MTRYLNLSRLLRRGDWREDVSAYMDGELSPAEAARVEARLAESAEMREYLADLEELSTVLHRFAAASNAASNAAPFQLTPEMLEGRSRLLTPPSGAARALRLSMSTAAIGAATFAAVVVFDALDSPTVRFTSTDAQVTVVPRTVISSESAESAAQPQSGGSMAAEAGEEQAAQDTAVAAVAEQSEAEQVEAEEAAAQAVMEQEAEQEATAQAEQAEMAAVEQAQADAVDAADTADPADVEQAASDPSRAALTAGRQRGSDGDQEAQAVTAADVVAAEQSEQSEPAAAPASDDAAAAEASAASPEQTASTPSEAQSSSESAAAQSVATESQSSPDSQAETAEAAAEPDGQSEARVVPVSLGEADWPLEQRPRSSAVQLATDPAWEQPLKIVLAAIAISAGVAWLTLTMVERRRI